MPFIRFFVNQRLLSALLAVALLAGGVWAWRALPIDAFPDATNVQVMILSQAPGLNTSEVERQITYPVELAMSGLPEVKEVRSLSKNALSQVRVVFEEGTDIYFARQLVHERLSVVEKELPQGVESEMAPISTGLGEVFQYTLEAYYTCLEHDDVWSPEAGTCPEDGKPLVPPSHGIEELRTLQDWEVAPRLRGLPGVTEVNSFGGRVRQFHVLPDPFALMKYDLSLKQLLQAVRDNNANVGGSFITNGEEQSYVVAKGLATSKEDLRRIVLKSESGTPITVGDVALVEEGSMTRQGAVTRDGRGEAVAGMTIMLKGENSREVVDSVKERLEEVQRTLPRDVRISPFYDRTDLIEATISTIVRALMEGGIFVILVLFLFLWDLRGALVVALSLPLTASMVFLAMGMLGLTANLMTLGGLAIAVGMVVDGTIVVVENIVQAMRRAENAEKSRVEVAMQAVSEVARPVLFSILVIVVVLLPLFTLQEVEGRMFKPMALTILLAMASSLVVALTVVPALIAWVASRKPEGPRGNPIVGGLLALYRPSLEWSIRHRWILASLSVAMMASVAVVLPSIGTEFLPPLDEGAIAVNIVRLPSASLEASARQATAIEARILEKFPEVTTVVSKTGRPEIAEDPMGPEQSDILIMLRPRDEWRPGMDRDTLLEELSALFAEFPGIRPSFSQPIALRVNELISGVKSDLAIKVVGDDLDKIRRIGEQIAPILSSIDGAEDVKVEQTTGLTEIEVVPNIAALSRHGLNVSDVNALVETAVGGTIVGQLYEGQRWFGIQVRFPKRYRDSIEAMKALPLQGTDGARMLLGEVAQIDEVEAPAQVSRDDSKRRLMVECNVRGRDLGSFVKEARDQLKEVEESLPTGTYLTWGGQFENQQRATRTLAYVVPIALLLILLMQLSALKNVRSTLLVVLNLPFSVVGGLGVIWLADMNISVSVLVGLVALFGMAVQHGTVLVSFIDQLRADGMAVGEAVREASYRRLRPLLMTKLTSVLGLIPILLADGPGSDVQRPLALVVLGGLAFTTLLNTFVVPAMYEWFHQSRRSLNS